jgi:uncharacterized protein (TIGR03084 family)
MAADIGALGTDLLAEATVLTDLLDPLDANAWLTPTPAEGWMIRDQITHLAYFDARARLAAEDPERFRREVTEARTQIGSMVDRITADLRRHDGAAALAWFRTERSALVGAVRSMDPSVRVPWYGPDMTIASSITARIMETWAHGVDIHDAVGVPIVPTPRLRHVAFIGARAFANSFLAHGREIPAVSVRVVLTEADGATWTIGPADAAETVTGSLIDFCLLVTQRRHRDDTDLVAGGPASDEWLSIAQAFAGPAGSGRAPSSTT